MFLSLLVIATNITLIVHRSNEKDKCDNICGAYKSVSCNNDISVCSLPDGGLEPKKVK